jgi:hypothetical protein
MTDYFTEVQLAIVGNEVIHKEKGNNGQLNDVSGRHRKEVRGQQTANVEDGEVIAEQMNPFEEAQVPWASFGNGVTA